MENAMESRGQFIRKHVESLGGVQTGVGSSGPEAWVTYVFASLRGRNDAVEAAQIMGFRTVVTDGTRVMLDIIGHREELLLEDELARCLTR